MNSVCLYILGQAEFFYIKPHYCIIYLWYFTTIDFSYKKGYTITNHIIVDIFLCGLIEV